MLAGATPLKPTNSYPKKTKQLKLKTLQRSHEKNMLRRSQIASCNENNIHKNKKPKK
ncbi:hypothetical protein GCM10009091_24990 [Pseudomonas brenneri]|nr:hypothetical protein GCM10009091_24990 [Pseudomonas brenneri]